MSRDARTVQGWGNAVHLTRWLFAQDSIWVTADGRELQVMSMEPDHILNTLLMVERCADLGVEDLQDTPLYTKMKDRLDDILKKYTTPTGCLGLAPDAEVQREREASRAALRVGDNFESIRSILDSAIMAGGQTVWMTYRDVQGVQTQRSVIPMRIEERHPGAGFPEDYLLAVDVDKDESRTFKVERIERVQEQS